MTIYNILNIKNKYLELYSFRPIGIIVRVFSNGPGDLGSITGRVIPKIQKLVLSASLLQGQVEHAGKGVALSPIAQCCSY